MTKFEELIENLKDASYNKGYALARVKYSRLLPFDAIEAGDYQRASSAEKRAAQALFEELERGEHDAEE